MMRSLFSAVSGLRTHQTRMDVIGNNVANVNTPGYKSSRVTFQEVFSQTLRGASSPTGTSAVDLGGMNPMQVGLGVSTAGIDTDHNSGNLQPTSRMSDIAIEGKGFFVLQDGTNRAYTRVGVFDTDGDGILVDSEGRKVLGWAPNSATGLLPTDKTPSAMVPMQIQIGSNMPARATDTIVWHKNLDSQAPANTVKSVPVTIYDSQGASHTITVKFTKVPAVGPNTWDYSIDPLLGTPILPNASQTSSNVVFDLNGAFDTTIVPPPVYCVNITLPGVSPMTVTLDFSGITQLAAPSTVDTVSVNGHPTGTLESYTFTGDGVISGFYSNGQTRPLGQVAVANFANAGGLTKLGKNLYAESNNSGAADIGEAGTGGRGTVAPSSLEMSNVDLAEEFTQMIITQRGFQANSRVITISDELLQELVNLKR